jgi:hypothetical protein
LKARWAILLTAATTLLGGWIAAGPVSHQIEFRVLGETGVETVRLTRNAARWTVMPERTIGTQWVTIRVACRGPLRSLQIHLAGLNHPPNMVSIQSGVVRVTSRNLFGVVVRDQDWLNVNTRYLGAETNKPLFPIDSVVMSHARAGFVGHTGYYDLVTP